MEPYTGVIVIVIVSAVVSVAIAAAFGIAVFRELAQPESIEWKMRYAFDRYAQELARTRRPLGPLLGPLPSEPGPGQPPADGIQDRAREG
jgi:hypothetical protein